LEQPSKTFGKCPLCGQHRPLTQQHVRLVAELKGRKMMICGPCHKIVTRYEDEVQRMKQHRKIEEEN